MIEMSVVFPRVGKDGFAFPFPYLCGERSGFGKARCWRLPHHRGYHRTLTGYSRWSFDSKLVVKNPSEDDVRFLGVMISLFRDCTAQDRRDYMELSYETEASSLHR